LTCVSPPRGSSSRRSIASACLSVSAAIGGIDKTTFRSPLEGHHPPRMTQQGREVVIVEAVRTPIGRGHREKGVFRDLHPATLLARTYTELIARAGIDAGEVEDVVTGCVQQFGEQGLNIGRTAWLQAGLPVKTAATTIDRQCGSSQ